MIENCLRGFASFLIAQWKHIMSFRASGAYMDVEIQKQNDTEYSAHIRIYPGIDEVVFNKIVMPKCEIAHTIEDVSDNPSNSDVIIIGWTYKPCGEYFKNELQTTISIPPKVRQEKPVETVVYFKPQKELTKVTVSVSGGWLNKLTVKRVLPSK